MNKSKRIVITGMGIVSCLGNDVDQFYRALLQGKSGVKTIEGFAYDDLSTQIAAQVPPFEAGNYFDKKQARRVDPFILYGIIAGKKAMENAFPQAEWDRQLHKERCGAIIASGMGGMNTLANGMQALLEKGPRRMGPFLIPYTITNMCSAILAIELGFMGPNYSISTACASANYAILAGVEHIRRGDVDLMLCGGTEAAITRLGMGGFIAAKTLSTRNDDPSAASRPWDKERDGFVMGEGAGVLVLENLEHALARGATIYGEYLGGASNCDAYHITSPREDGSGIQACIEKAIADAAVDKKRINYINAHATSTLVGDIIELQALNNVFPQQSDIRINATKSLVGHCLGAAGAVEAIATIQACHTGQLHPTLNLDNIEPAMAFSPVLNRAESHSVDVALSNSFGFGGHNAVLAFSPFQE